MKRVKRPRRKSVTTMSAPQIQFSTTFCKMKNPNFGANIKYKDNVVAELSKWDQLKAFASLHLNN